MFNIERERSYAGPLSNSPLLWLLLSSLTTQRNSPRCSSIIKDEYDYIVVGGGAAGSVVASRLSEVPCASVLVLEAGPAPPLLTDVPALSDYLKETDVDWKFKTVPQKHGAFGLENREVKWASGKMLGGSGNHNGMVYIRGTQPYYDDWEALGCTGWSYKDVFPYFLKLEDFRIPYLLHNGYHAVGGPITVSQSDIHSVLKDALISAAIELRYPFVDPNAQSETGFYDVQKNMRNGQRCSSVKAYLVPAENRTNLDILVNAFVTKIIIEDGEAKGVEYFKEGRCRFVKAKKEVILSAGTVSTPKILMLSGIGPEEELRKWNIPVITNLPVGKNLQEHASTLYLFTLDPRLPSFDKKLSDPENIFEYIMHRTGILTSSPTVLQAHLNGQSPSSLTDRPDYGVLFGELSDNALKGLNLKEEVYKEFAEPYKNRAVNRCKVELIKPRSRGRIVLNSTDPFEHPLIDPNYFEIERDLEDIVNGLKMCQKIIQSKAMQKLGARPFNTVVPGCEKLLGNEDAYYRCYAQNLVFANYHAVGTSKMGHSLDPTAVVDPQLRVKGIKGLRVVDASVMPTIPSPNIHIPTIMIAEKAADMIKKSLFCCE